MQIHRHNVQVGYLLQDEWFVFCACSDSRKAGLFLVFYTKHTAAQPLSLTYRKGCPFTGYLPQLGRSTRVMSKGMNHLIDSWSLWQFCNSSTVHPGIRPWWRRKSLTTNQSFWFTDWSSLQPSAIQAPQMRYLWKRSTHILCGRMRNLQFRRTLASGHCCSTRR